MGRETSISWTDHTFNPWWGCTEVSPGCDNCYAKTMDNRIGGGHWGKGAPRRQFGDKHWAQPLLWNADARDAGIIKRVFCASMGDVNDDEAPAGERERLWALIDRTPYLLWQLLTKRPQRFVRYLPKHGFVHNNVMLGATTENQKFYNLRSGHLQNASIYLRTRGQRHVVRTFISYEPAIGPITMVDNYFPDWLIFGGETGSPRRPMELEWAESIKRECDRLNVAFFMKQLSARTPSEAAALIPAHMLTRQFPEVL